MSFPEGITGLKYFFKTLLIFHFLACILHYKSMAEFKITPVICSVVTAAAAFKAPDHIDLHRYAGKWYVIGTIPTKFDEDWNYTTETYTLRPGGNIDILTVYQKKGSATKKELHSKGFPVTDEKNVHWKVQFYWPFRVDYMIEEIADDYSWVVVGHPKKKFLYIMSRTRTIEDTLFSAITERCRRSGYDLSKLRKVKQ
jgi:apolipoprotein D and lipocalin family protein